MNRGFYAIMAAQFFSSLADNALLITAIAVLVELNSPLWMTPLLKLFFSFSYVILAAFVGAFADALPKGRVMFITNLIKIFGCATMFFSVHPLFSYALVGFGAAAYSPAKYGILTELLPAEKLVAANGWIEGLTVASIIIGTMLGGALLNPVFSSTLLRFDFPFFDTSIQTPAQAALCIVMLLYGAAALFNLKIPDTGARYPHQQCNPVKLIKDFSGCFMVLWRDKLGQISLAVTTLFWGAGATLQFIVLKWAEKSLLLSFDKAAILQGIVAVGVAIGAVVAAVRISLKNSLSVLPVGVVMGLVVMGMSMLHDVSIAYFLLLIIGILSGYFVVPMNALLQHRGHVLMCAGHSIAVQNFNENLSILALLGLYALMISLNLDINHITILFGLFVALAMILIICKHIYNERKYNSMALLDDKHDQKAKI